MFMCETSLTSLYASSTILKTGKQYSNGCGSIVIGARSLDLYPNSILKSSASFNDSDTLSDGSQADGHTHTDIDKQGTDDTFYATIGAARRALAKNRTGEGMYKLLLAFKIFKPSLHLDRSSA